MNKYNENYTKESIKTHMYTYYEYIQIINKFNENCVSDYFHKQFRMYYYSKITEKEFYKHLIYILNRINNNHIEELIMEEKDLIPNKNSDLKFLYDKYDKKL